MRYELSRQFAPYLGISGERAFFETARLRRDAGESAGELRGVVGIRAWL
ncbi:MAG: copper resistance protein B [bacterium]